MIFYLGTHEPSWLGRTDVPLFVSRRRLVRRSRKRFSRALGPWALDSGGFSELSLYGKWTTTPACYVREVRRFSAEIGNLSWAAIQDWMCEPHLLTRTGLSVREHQRRTIDSYRALLELAPDLPWVPVLQGWAPDDYWRHLDDYDRSGLPFRQAPVMGLGSVCRRQHLQPIANLVTTLAGEGLCLHAFGVKTKGLEQVSTYLASSDSMAWSYAARKRPALPGHTHHNCANCFEWAFRWREGILETIANSRARPGQRLLFGLTS